jgi:anthranilate phosphoribosyltransferase
MPSSRPWVRLLTALMDGSDLSASDTSWVMTQVIQGDASPARLAAFLMGLRAKGETAEEIAGLVQAVHEHGTRIFVPGVFVDIVGTGGDGSGVVNISTMASLVVAATGTTVVKHGGRGASSPSGSADVLECLGLDLDLPVERVAELADEVGITYCFAPRFHPGLRHAGPTRRELGVPTVFNVLAPLINPAQPKHQLVGVAPSRMTTVIADVLAARGCTALVVRGDDGLDKLTTTTTSQVWIVRDGHVCRTLIRPEELGIPQAKISELRGGAAQENATVVRRLLDGQHGPIRDVVLLNAAAALVAVNPREESLTDELRAGLARCAEAIDSGAAARVLARWISATQT